MDIVRLPGKSVAVSLADIPVGEARVGSPYLLWSADSKWFILTGLGEGFRDTNMMVYRSADGKFIDVPVDGLSAPATPPKGATDDLRAEFVKPLRWVKPGTLQFRQDSYFRVKSDGVSGLVYQEVTSAYSAEKNEFRVVASKKVKGPRDFALEADVRLNAAHKELQGKLSAAGKATLKQEQTEWLTQRDAIADDEQQTEFVDHRTAELRERAKAIR